MTTTTRPDTLATPDWGLGRYEHTATQLLPAAHAVVDRAAPRPGEYVVDIGCGTGNGALLAAQRGARVVGVDPAARLLDVARAEAGQRRLTATFELGTAAALPIADGAADVAISVFGLIFAPDPHAAVAELARVSAPNARVVLSAWIPQGPLNEVARLGREAVAQATGAPAGAPPFPWHDQDALQGLFRPLGFDVSSSEHRIAFTGTSPRAYLDAESAHHPLAVAARAAVGARVDADGLHARMLAVYEEANEDADAFRITSRFVVAIARRM